MKDLKTVGDLKKALESIDNKRVISVHGNNYFEIRDSPELLAIVGYYKKELTEGDEKGK